MGGTDELSNLITLCDGCHAAHHPNLAGGLARGLIERWAVRLARWIDTTGSSQALVNFGPALRLFGVHRFREGQLPIVLAALCGKSVLVVSPTGSGKTLCFQLPAMLRHGPTIVVSPLKTLMADQVSNLLSRKIPATFINSDLAKDEKRIRFELLKKGAIKLLYLAPERFFVRSEEERNGLKRTRPSFLVIDEAHCVDQWGRDFRPEYGRLQEVREKLGKPTVLAFTATAGREMQQRILSSLGVNDAVIFVRGVDRPNIALVRVKAHESERVNEIAKLLRLRDLQGQKAMIFVPSIAVGERLKNALAQLGLEIPFYHSSLGTPWDRQELVKRFVGQSRPVADQIICTNAFGMGLDVPNVRLVVHWQQSASVEDQLQEYGRAGRDGRASAAVIFHEGRPEGRDVGRLKFMAEKTAEAAKLSEVESIRMRERRFRQIDQLSAILHSSSCFREAVIDYFEGAKKRQPLSLSTRILDWVFASRHQAAKTRFCCDHCDAALIKKSGAVGYVAEAVRERR